MTSDPSSLAPSIDSRSSDTISASVDSYADIPTLRTTGSDSSISCEAFASDGSNFISYEDTDNDVSVMSLPSLCHRSVMSSDDDDNDDDISVIHSNDIPVASVKPFMVDNNMLQYMNEKPQPPTCPSYESISSELSFVTRHLFTDLGTGLAPAYNWSKDLPAESRGSTLDSTATISPTDIRDFPELTMDAPW